MPPKLRISADGWVTCKAGDVPLDLERGDEIRVRRSNGGPPTTCTIRAFAALPGLPYTCDGADAPAKGDIVGYRRVTSAEDPAPAPRKGRGTLDPVSAEMADLRDKAARDKAAEPVAEAAVSVDEISDPVAEAACPVDAEGLGPALVTSAVGAFLGMPGAVLSPPWLIPPLPPGQRDAAAHELRQGDAGTLTFEDLRAALALRAQEYSGAYAIELYALAFGGAAGAVLDVMKTRMSRHLGVIMHDGLDDLMADEVEGVLSDRMAEALITLAELARRLGIDLGVVVPPKFNATSEAQGLEARLSPEVRPARAERAALVALAELCDAVAPLDLDALCALWAPRGEDGAGDQTLIGIPAGVATVERLRAACRHAEMIIDSSG